jgi:hypothetical protein
MPAEAWPAGPCPWPEIGADQGINPGVLGVKDGVIGSATSAARRARHILGSEVEILPNAGHVMDEPDFVGTRIIDFLK